MPTNYLSADQLADIIGIEALIIAAPDADDGYDAGRVEAAIAAVGEKIDAELLARYEIPLTEVSDYIRRLAARLAHAELVGDSDMTDLIASRADQARADLKRISRGEIRLGADGQGARNTGKSEASGNYNIVDKVRRAWRI